MATICVVTAGHLATCPRMVKAADAFAAVGHDVRVVSTRFEPWATAADAAVLARRAWHATIVDYTRSSGMTYWTSGAAHRVAAGLTQAIGPRRAPAWLAARAVGRVHDALVRAIAAQPADLVYAGTRGALAAAARAARHLGVPYALDLEDFHPGESSGSGASVADALADRLLRDVLRRAAFVTTASAAMASAYRDSYGVEPIVINNTFPLPPAAPSFSSRPRGPLRVYWFSQTIGPGRGLEDAVHAMGLAAIDGELHVQGQPLDGYLDVLKRAAADRACRLTIVHHPPAAPDQLVDAARRFDVGLALEGLTPRNRALCLTNKAFTYILAGLVVAMTDTPGQHALGVDLGAGAALVRPGDADALAAAFKRWATDAAALEEGRRAAWDAARRRWHWEHPAERGALVNAMTATLERQPTLALTASPCVSS